MTGPERIFQKHEKASHLLEKKLTIKTCPRYQLLKEIMYWIEIDPFKNLKSFFLTIRKQCF